MKPRPESNSPIPYLSVTASLAPKARGLCGLISVMRHIVLRGSLPTGGATRRRGYAFMYGNGDWEAIQACHEQSMCEAMDEVLAEREKEERSVKGRSASSVRNRAPRLKAVPGLETPKRFSVQHTFQSLLPCTVLRRQSLRQQRSQASQRRVSWRRVPLVSFVSSGIWLQPSACR